MKRQGPIWLGLTESVHSLRAYPAFADFGGWSRARPSPNCAIRRCGSPARSLGMALVYLAPPLFAIFAHGARRERPERSPGR